MTVYDILTLAQPLISSIEQSGANATDVKYLKLYEDYKQLKEKGEKIRWIASHLSQKHNTAESTIFNIIKRLDKNI